MYIKIFEYLKNDSEITNFFGEGNDFKIFPHGFGLQNLNNVNCYVVYQIITGSPQNNLTKPPKSDNFTLSFRVVSKTLQNLNLGKKILINSLEKVGYIQSFDDEGVDLDTKLFYSVFTYTYFQQRSD